MCNLDLFPFLFYVKSEYKDRSKYRKKYDKLTKIQRIKQLKFKY